MWTKELRRELWKTGRISCRTQRNNDPDGLGGLYDPKSTSTTQLLGQHLMRALEIYSTEHGGRRLLEARGPSYLVKSRRRTLHSGQ